MANSYLHFALGRRLSIRRGGRKLTTDLARIIIRSNLARLPPLENEVSVRPRPAHRCWPRVREALQHSVAACPA